MVAGNSYTCLVKPQENRRPPLREAFFLVTLPPAYQREMLLGCPGMVVPWLLIA